MKTSLAILLTIVVLSPLSVSAREFSELTIETVPRISHVQEKCNSKTKELNGCFVKETDTVYVRESLDPKFFMMVYLHEIGHFYTEDTDRKILRKLFSEGKKGYREESADDFVFWMFAPYLLSEEKNEFFESLGVDRLAVLQSLQNNWPYN